MKRGFFYITSAGNAVAYRGTEKLIGNLGHKLAGKQIAQSGTEVLNLKAKSRSFFKALSCFFIFIVYFTHYLLFDGMPKERHRKNVGNLMGTAGLHKSFTGHILGEDHGVPIKSVPEIHGNKSENVVEGQKAYLL